MRTPYDVLVRPIVTEKSNDEIAIGKYTFEVAKDATKVEVKQAVEKVFSVKVVSVNTLNVLGKQKRVGVHQGKRSDWKKAIVRIDTNPEDKKYKDSIEVFGGLQA